MENAPIELMSKLTESLLLAIDYKEVKRIREENFLYLHEKLEGLNGFKFDLDEFQGPMVYPFYAESTKLKKRLLDHKIFVPTYWKEVHSRVDKSSVEAKYSDNLLALPIDHRYTLSEMKFVLNLI